MEAGGLTSQINPIRWAALEPSSEPTVQMVTLGPRELGSFVQAHRAGKQQPWGLNPHQLCCKTQTSRRHCLPFLAGSLRTEVTLPGPPRPYAASDGLTMGQEQREAREVLCQSTVTMKANFPMVSTLQLSGGLWDLRACLGLTFLPPLLPETCVGRSLPSARPPHLPASWCLQGAPQNLLE